MVNDEEFKKAPNLEAILDWVDARRPDVSEDVRGILAESWQKNKQAEALVFLLTIGFAAGRKYQQDHPTLNADHTEYHR